MQEKRFLIQWIREYRKQWCRERLRRMYLWLIPSMLIFTSTLVLLEIIFHFSSAVRWGFVTGSLLLWLIVILAPILIYVVRLKRNNPSDFFLVQHFQRHPQGSGRLFNGYELISNDAPLSQYAVELVEDELKELPASSMFSRQSDLQQFYKTTIYAFGFFFLLNLIPAGGNAVARLLMPSVEFGDKAPYQLVWDQSSNEYARNEPIERVIQIKTITAPPSTNQGTLYVKEEGRSDVTTYPILFSSDTAIIRLEPRIGILQIQVSLGTIRSEELELKPFQRTRFENVVYSIYPPSYTGLLSSTSNGGTVSILKGTRIDFSATLVGTLSHLYTVFGTDTLGLKEVDKKVSGSFFIKNEGVLSFRIFDNEKRVGQIPPPLVVQLLTDETPIVSLLAPDKDMNIPGSLRFPVIAKAEDDFGIQSLYIVYRFTGNRPESAWDSMRLPIQNPANLSEQTQRHGALTTAYSGIEWDVSRFDLLPDDVIEFFISAYDENNVTGPNRGVSALRKMNVPSLEQWLQESEEMHSALSGDLQSISRSGEQVAKSLEDLAQKLKRKGELNHEEREKARGALEKQQQLAEQVEKSAKDLRELSQKLDESGAVAQQTLEKLARLQDLMNELASPELKDAMKQLQEALKKMDQNQIRAAMEKLQVNQKDWLEKLDRSLALLEQLRLEKRLDMLEKWSKQVSEEARREQIKSDSLTSSNSQKASQELSKLANESKSLEEQVAQTAEDAKNSPHFDSDDVSEMQQANQPEKAASEMMKQAAKQMQSQNYDGGKKGTREAAQRAEELAQKVAEWNKQLREKSKQDLANKMQRRIGELLQLSRSQMDLQSQYTPLDVRTPQARSLADRQESLRRGLTQVVDSLASLGRETFFLPRGLQPTLQRAEQSMVQARNSITERMGGAQYNQEQARAAMNEAVAQLLQSLGELEQSNSSTGYEEMMQALADMARKQAQLNDKTDQMMGEGGMPMPDGSPMEMSGGSMPGGTQGMLQQMAAEQGALANMMKGLEQKSDQMRELTGRLQGLSNEMSEAEKQLQDKILTDRTQRLQERILTRLLDAQRSLQKQDYTQKRESKTGQNLGGRVTIDYDPSSIENRLRSKLLELSRMGLEPIWQKRIRQYWQYLQANQPQDSARVR